MINQGGTIWWDRNIFPYKIGFCPSERAWKSTLKFLGIAPEPYPMKNEFGACMKHFGAEEATGVTNKVDFAIVAVADYTASSDTRCEFIASMLVHEATHVWKHTKVAMGETNPSSEFEAYMVQHISLFLFDAYAKTRGTLFRTNKKKKD